MTESAMLNLEIKVKLDLKALRGLVLALALLLTH
jgi:hypothetical protein